MGLGQRGKTAAVSATGLGLFAGCYALVRGKRVSKTKTVVVAGVPKMGVRYSIKRTRSQGPSDYAATLTADDRYSSLFQTVKADLDERGVSRETVIETLEDLRVALDAEGRGDDEEAVSDVVDAIYGFAPARSRL